MTDASEWFTKLAAQLADRQPNIDLLDSYYIGAHPLPYMGRDLDEEIRRLHRMCSANWCELVVNSAADALRVLGVRRGDGPSGLEAGLKVMRRWWQPNKLDRGQRQLFRRALSCERSFTLVWPRARANGQPTGPATITVESPRQMIVAYQPGSTIERAAALKSFFDDGWCYQCLWTPEKVYRRKVKTASVADGKSWTQPGANAPWEPWYYPGEEDGPDPYLDGLSNPMAVVPVVEFAANPNDEGEPTSDLACVIPAQNRINETLCNRVFTARAQAYPERVLIGEPIRTDPTTGQPVNPLKKGPERTHQFTNKDARIDAWDAADLGGFIESVRSDIMEITSLSRTPPNITIAELTNIGADALRALKESFNGKTFAHQDYFSDPLEETLRLAMLADGDEGGDDEALELIWADPDAPSLSERATAVSQMGPYLPRSQLYAVAGLTPEGIDDAIAEDDLQQSRQELINRSLPNDQAAVPPAAAPAA